MSFTRKKTTKAESVLMASILDELSNIKNFPQKKPFKDNTRKNVVAFKKGRSIQAFVLGKVRSFSESDLVNASKNKRFPGLLVKLSKLIKLHAPSYRWTSIQINKNVATTWHKDKFNIGFSYCLGLGSYTRGGLDLAKDDKKFIFVDNKNSIVKYDGHNLHRTSARKGGDRYAIIWFRHS